MAETKQLELKILNTIECKPKGQYLACKVFGYDMKGREIDYYPLGDKIFSVTFQIPSSVLSGDDVIWLKTKPIGEPAKIIVEKRPKGSVPEGYDVIVKGYQKRPTTKNSNSRCNWKY